MFALPKKLLIIDVETSGVTENSSIIQIGAVILDKSGRLSSKEFSEYIIPYTINWSEDAEKIHNISRNFLAKNGKPLKQVLEAFEEWATIENKELKKEYWLGQWSCGFDTTFLQNAYECVGMKYPFHYRAFDVASIVRWELACRGKLYKKCGESKCAEALGIEVEDSKLHDGLYDARLSGQMLERLARGGK
ncbi:hypothetical protein LCGC14_1332990 [marine sediment metagenome]|uniref:Exonuclease domain-containing protein n=1 Tax=marine sediment metagenome TaxID=412755 RepID=A0A0F9KFX3_9ZZZZ